MIPSLLLSLALGPTPARAAVPPASYQLKLGNYDVQIRDFNFPSGLRIMFQSEHSQPVVAITLVFDRGSEHDQPGYEGIAHVVEHLAFRAEHAGLPKNWDLIAQLGGNINASTSNDWTNYMTVAPVDAMVPLLRLEALRMKDGVANVTQEVVRLESEIARNELRMRYENAAIGAAWDLAAEGLYPPDHPYRRSTIGNHESLSRIDLPHVQEFVRENYKPQYATIVVVGDFQPEQAWPAVLQAFETELELLMAPDDAKAYLALKTPAEKNAFIEAWVPRLQAYMQQVGQTGVKPRVDCANRAPAPPRQTGETRRTKGMVDVETVVLAWSLPGGYCNEDMLYNVAANNLANQIYYTLNSDWNFSESDGALEGIGCFPSPDRYHTTMYCFIEPKAAGGNKGEALIKKAADALYLQWDRSLNANPVYKAFFEWSFNSAKTSQMTDTLLSVDLVASLGGRATQTAMYTHFTGDPAYFSSNMNMINKVDFAQVQALAQKYLTRERMTSIIVEPMDKEERDRREAAAKAAKGQGETAAAYHATKAEDRFRLLFSRESLTPEAIERVTVTPDVDAVQRFDLPNGLKVAILPYGEAPIVRVGLEVRGNNQTSDPVGLNNLAENLYSSGLGLAPDENPLRVASRVGASNNVIFAEGPAGNLDALLHQVRHNLEGYDWLSAKRVERVKKLRSDTHKAGDKASAWAGRVLSERLFPNHPLGFWWNNERLDQAATWTMDQYKAWIFRKWQPSNAELVIVGRVDPAEARAAVERYMGGWESRAADKSEVPDMPKPTALPDRQVLVFDDPIATQTDITLGCQIVRDTSRETARAQVVSDVISDRLWKVLREDAGVTYGAYSGPSLYPGGAAALYMNSLVQNDAVGFAVKNMIKIGEEAADGKVDEDALLAAKWTRARQYGLGQQSGQQMLDRLIGNDIDKLDFFKTYPKDLAAVSAADFPKVLSTCKGHEVITLIGPASYAVEQLTAEGIPFEVVDWEALHVSQLDKKELKAWQKKKAAEAKKAAGGA